MGLGRQLGFALKSSKKFAKLPDLVCAGPKQHGILFCKIRTALSDTKQKDNIFTRPLSSEVVKS